MLLPVYSNVAFPPVALPSQSGYSFAGSQYLVVGGQDGAWFSHAQTPELRLVFLSNMTVVKVDVDTSSGGIWYGTWNGSQLIISGWGHTQDGDPYVATFSAQMAPLPSRPIQNSQWTGGDVFSASYNGKEWLLTGMDAGPFVTNGSLFSHNHMAFGIYDAAGFTDLSALIPHQQVGVLYTGRWNGSYWLVGGGYVARPLHSAFGVLFLFNGTAVVDLTEQIKKAVPEFGSVQKAAWNGAYWLIGGVGFLAKYDGVVFTDLTPQLQNALSGGQIYAVNSMGWNGSMWMLAGGAPKGVVESSTAWVVSYDAASGFAEQFSMQASDSSILSLSKSGDLWAFSGYMNRKALLIVYWKGEYLDLSYLVKDMSYATLVLIMS